MIPPLGTENELKMSEEEEGEEEDFEINIRLELLNYSLDFVFFFCFELFEELIYDELQSLEKMKTDLLEQNELATEKKREISRIFVRYGRGLFRRGEYLENQDSFLYFQKSEKQVKQCFNFNFFFFSFCFLVC